MLFFVQGKSTIILSILKDADIVLTPKPVRIYVMYSIYQPIYQQLRDHLLPKGIDVVLDEHKIITDKILKEEYAIPDPTDKDKYLPIVIFYDDAIPIIRSNTIADTVCKSRHVNASIFMAIHKLYLPFEATKIVNQNAFYIIFVNSKRTRSQVKQLGIQLGRMKSIVSAFDQQTTEPYTYILIDLFPDSPFLIRSNVVNINHQIVYIPDEDY